MSRPTPLRTLRRNIATIAFVFAFASAHAQTPAHTHPTSTPYSGDLSIFEDAGRADRLHIDRVMDVLRLKPGKVVADIGAGGGWFSVRAARRVASEKPGQPGGQVIAEDINTHAVDSIRERAQREHLGNIEPILGTPDDPKLPPNMLDAALMLRVYHEVAHPTVLLANLNRAMKPGALFGVIDHDGHGDDHGINADVVRAEVERSGLHFVRRYDFTSGDQNDYFLVFEKR
jgi:ubiquinone/menaquinone biosynthesis C-methylase UbiE